MSDIFDKCHRFFAGLEADRQAFAEGVEGVFFVESPVNNAGPVMEQDGREALQFGTNDYLGMAAHEGVIGAAAAAAKEHGASHPMGSRPLTGTTALHLELEQKIAAFKGTAAAVTFSTGAGAMTGALACLAEPGDTVIMDHLVHGSLHSGAQISGAELRFFRHNDAGHLERLLAALPQDCGKIVVVDGVYSLRGDIAPLIEISRVCKAAGARLFVDDAHGNGVFGRGGRGIVEHLGLPPGAVDLHAGTFSKAFGCSGGFVAGDEVPVRYIRATAPTLIFSKAAPACSVAAILAALPLVEGGEHLRKRLWENTHCLQSRLREQGFDTGTTVSPITPLEFELGGGVLMADALRRRYGIWVGLSIFPGVRRGVSAIRIIPTASHTEEQIGYLVDSMVKVREERNLRQPGGAAG